MVQAQVSPWHFPEASIDTGSSSSGRNLQPPLLTKRKVSPNTKEIGRTSRLSGTGRPALILDRLGCLRPIPKSVPGMPRLDEGRTREELELGYV